MIYDAAALHTDAMWCIQAVKMDWLLDDMF